MARTTRSMPASSVGAGGCRLASLTIGPSPASVPRQLTARRGRRQSEPAGALAAAHRPEVGCGQNGGRRMSTIAARPTTYAEYAAMNRFTVEQYHKMIETGILDDEDKLELLEGYLVLKMPRDS